MTGPVVITGGGTGGHAYPMVAIAEALEARGLGAADLRFVASRRAHDERFLAGDVGVTLLGGRGLRRSLRAGDVVANLVALLGLVGAFVRALALLGRWRATVVVSVGGYASLATTCAAWCRRTPLVLVEFDVVAGASQRLFYRYAAARCRSFGNTDTSAKTYLTGAPLRVAIERVDRSPGARVRARASMDPPIGEGRLVVVVMTGSLGSTRVNRAVRELAERWSARSDRTLIHVTGRRDYDDFRDAPPSAGLDYRVIEFGDMAGLFAVADLAVCRAGAISVAELTALAIPSILVPLPGSPGDHQTKNARAVVDAGGARLIRDADCDGASLAAAIETMSDPDTLAAMTEGAATLAHRGAAAAIADVITSVRDS